MFQMERFILKNNEKTPYDFTTSTWSMMLICTQRNYLICQEPQYSEYSKQQQNEN